LVGKPSKLQLKGILFFQEPGIFAIDIYFVYVCFRFNSRLWRTRWNKILTAMV